MKKNLKQKHFKLCYIDEEYIEFLRRFDKIVPMNKNRTRPYVGVVYTYNNINYFAPLSSPKEKHLNMNYKQLDIYKIDDGRLGIININNMLPTPIDCLTEVIPTVKEEKYKKLLENQLTFINKPDNAKVLLKKIEYFQRQYRKGHLPEKIIERTCNFTLLEEKYEEWIKDKNNHTIFDFVQNTMHIILDSVQEEAKVIL